MGKVFTREQFVDRAISIHGDKYDYSRINFVDMRTPVDVFCNFHQKTWPVSPYGHARPNGTGSECRYCKGRGRTTQDFIEAATLVHGDKYDYSKVNYSLAKKKVKVFCPKHDHHWETTWHSHVVCQHGCIYCGKEFEKNLDDLIKLFKKVHGEKYDYSLYKKWEGWHKPMDIICKKHDGFICNPTPASHLNQKVGCRKCWALRQSLVLKKPQELYFQQVKAVHGEKYDYSQTEYKGDKKYITVICKKENHGPFSTRSDHHLNGSGCQECGKQKIREARTYSFNQFYNIANETHLGKYTYKKETYTSYLNETMTIICPIHGEFEQRPVYHAHGKGCSDCRQSKGERDVERFLLNMNVKYEKQKKFPECKRKQELPFDFWIPSIKVLIEYDGEQHHIERNTGIFKGQFEDIKQRDKIKDEFCDKVGFILLRIRWDEDLNKELSMFFDAFKASK